MLKYKLEKSERLQEALFWKRLLLEGKSRNSFWFSPNSKVLDYRFYHIDLTFKKNKSLPRWIDRRLMINHEKSFRRKPKKPE